MWSRAALRRGCVVRGQTASFSIPVLEKVDVTLQKTQALILVPTRELALQTSSVLKKLGQHIPHLSVIVSTGGTDLKEDIVRLMKPVHVIVATPGRILDLCNKVATQRGTAAARRLHCPALLSRVERTLTAALCAPPPCSACVT